MGLLDLFKKKEKAPSVESMKKREECVALARQFVSDEQYKKYLDCLTENQRNFISRELKMNYRLEDQIWGERLILRVLYLFNTREKLTTEWDKRMEKYQEERRGQTIEKYLPGYDPSEFAWLDEEKKALDALGNEILNHTNELKSLYGQWPKEFDRIGTIPYINDKRV